MVSAYRAGDDQLIHQSGFSMNDRDTKSAWAHRRGFVRAKEKDRKLIRSEVRGFPNDVRGRRRICTACAALNLIAPARL